MAIDPDLFDTYHQYKAGTNKVMTWLASRARETSVLSELFPITSETKGKGRLKGKARTAAKKVTPQKHQVPLAFITRIAKSVAGISKVKVPESIIRTLEEVIAARSACNDYFEKQGAVDTSTKISNTKHQHFIEVLSETLQILKPLDRATDQTKKTKGAEAKVDENIANLCNRFAYLEVEEPTESEWIPSPLPSKANKAAAPKYELELERTDEDISFAIFCMLKDLTEIRHYVRQTWAEYREHQLAFTTAALTMNTAIAIFRRLNEEFVSEFPQFKDHGAIIDYLYEGYRDPNSQDKKDFGAYVGPNFKISSKIFFCDHTYSILRGFFMEVELPFYQDKISPEVRLTQDEKTLLKCLSLLGLLNTQFKGKFHNDQLIQGLHILKTDNPDEDIYTWVVFAVQLFVDARRVVGNELAQCFQEAREIEKWMSLTVEQSIRFGRTNSVNTWYKINPLILPQLKQQFDNKLKKDFVQELVDDVFGDRAALYSWGPFYLLRNHPMLLGLITQDFLAQLHETGMALTRDQASVMTSIHLYNAAQQFGKIPGGLEWTDLDRVIDWQGSSWVFVGDRPQNPGDSFTHYNLVLGTSATVLSRDRNGKTTARPRKTARSIIPPTSQKKIRRLRLMSTYVELMNAPANFTRPGTAWLVKTRAANEPLVMLEMLVARYLESNAETKDQVSTTRKNNASAHPKVHPLSMISIFKDYLKSEEKILRFDLLSLNQRCVELLRKVQKVCVEQSPLDYPPNEYGVERHVNSVFPHMMAAVYGVEHLQPTRFREACLMVKELAEAVGDQEYGKSNSLCFIKGDGNKKVTDSFSTPVEDLVLVNERLPYSRMIIVGGPSGQEITII